MPDPDILISVENVSKKFCRSLKRSLWYGICDTAADVFASRGSHERLRKDEFWANQDVSFELRRGECLGLIGRNGAGKTTLLKMLNGLIKPDKGAITMRGSIGALIALGAGFNPILTGRENVYINGSVLGLTKRQIADRLDEIVDFSELSGFIDTPVQNYSSGMQVRLGFAVAAVLLKPDVLILDEVLAVGDLKFRTKCYSQIGKLIENSAVIFVSHQVNSIQRICDRVMVLNDGKTEFFGGVEEGIELYKTMNTSDLAKPDETISIFDERLTLDLVNISTKTINTGEQVSINIRYKTAQSIPLAYISATLVDEQGVLVAQYRSDSINQAFSLEPFATVLNIPLGPIPLTSGRYAVSCSGFAANGKSLIFAAGNFESLKVIGRIASSASVELGVLQPY